ncbi:Werner Syndrome-like exonuclease [Melia azedarach]|uniref:Werner Syndrome-like exonuclease n=1 Tax=Melia azedarach TaxID=155640 RepID=A0ACC1X6G1_MELAZ|nr:Werner Syndrome-like exonuclease [Melia azedarach]
MPNPFNIKRMNYSTWNVKFWGDNIITTVTSRTVEVDLWVKQTLNEHRSRVNDLVVGLDTEWCLPTVENDHQKVAIIQLCVGMKWIGFSRCLIFQFCQNNNKEAPVPLSLVRFLGNRRITFVGKEVKNDARKLLEDYGLLVGNVRDVSEMAASKYNDKEFLRLGLSKLVVQFLNVGMEKPKEITMSEWDKEELSDRQIQYAAIDGFVSFKLGFELMKPRKY